MEDLKDARVLVTGSDGFIGSHVVEELVRAGATRQGGRALQLLQLLGLARYRFRRRHEIGGSDRRRHQGSALHDRGRRRMHRRHASGGADRDSVFLSSRPTPMSTPTSAARSTSCRRPAMPASRASSRRRPAKSMAARSSCRSTRAIRCQDNRPTRHRRSLPTRWRCRFMPPSTCRWSWSGRSTPTGRGNRRAP